MKLEKVVSRPKTGLWVFLFILAVVAAGVMATSYNVEIVHNVQDLPWTKITMGGIGFFGIIISLVLFFARLIREMKVTQFHADFLDRISHELRTPLSTMTLVSDLLRDKAQDLTAIERERLWKSHEQELDRLKADVESLLQAARLRESRHQVHIMTVDLEKFLNEKWPSFERLLGPGARLTRKFDLHSAQVRVDPGLLELILRNLLDNAKKFALGEPVVELIVQAYRSRIPKVILPFLRLRMLRPFLGSFIAKKRFQITVRDHGLGFSPSSQPRLFKRFSRIEPQSNQYQEHAIPGTGLGLYLSASASRAMGMTLSGASRGEGRGAEFKLIGELQ